MWIRNRLQKRVKLNPPRKPRSVRQQNARSFALNTATGHAVLAGISGLCTPGAIALVRRKENIMIDANPSANCTQRVLSSLVRRLIANYPNGLGNPDTHTRRMAHASHARSALRDRLTGCALSETAASAAVAALAAAGRGDWTSCRPGLVGFSETEPGAGMAICMHFFITYRKRNWN